MQKGLPLVHLSFNVSTMAKLKMILIGMLLMNVGYSQRINDSLFYASFIKTHSQYTDIKGNNFFTYGVYPYNSTIFNSFARKSGTSFQMSIGVSQQFSFHPADPYWNGSSPLSPMLRGPGFPNFIPYQTRPSFGIKNATGTLYSFSAGSVDMGSINMGFREMRILKPLGKKEKSN
jgi:hypothetical protein